MTGREVLQNMRTAIVKMTTIKDIQQFVRKASTIAGEVDLIQGKYRVPATSLMSIFALDLEKPIKIEFDETIYEEVNYKLSEFMSTITSQKE